MINASREFIEAVNSDRSDYRVSLRLTTTTLGFEHVFDITNEDIWDGTFKIEDATAPGEDFVIGAFVSTKLTFSLYNKDNESGPGRTYDRYDFNDAVIDNVRLSFPGMETGINLGKFYVDNAAYDGTLITLTCTDGARFFNKPYSDSFSYVPTDSNRATLWDIARGAVAECLGSVSYFMPDHFPNWDYTPDAFSPDSLTYADVIAMCAQLAGCFAKLDTGGVLRFAWYPNRPNDPVSDRYDPVYAEQHGYHVLKSLKAASIAKEDCYITKVRVTEEFAESESAKRDTQSYPADGSDDYVMAVEGNRLIGAGKAAEAAEMIGSCMIDTSGDITVYKTFRPLSVTALSNPLIESGDFAYVITRGGYTYPTFITSRSFSLGNGVSITCAGKALPVNNQTSYSATAKIIERTQKEMDKMETEAAAARALLQDRMFTDIGFYKTEEAAVGGGTIVYYHDKETLAASTYIWKFDSDSVVCSDHGLPGPGEDWPGVLDAGGNAMLNYLAVDKLEANWIKTGTLDVDLLTVAGRLKDNTTPSNNFWNLNTGGFQFKSQKTLLNNDGLVLYYIGTGQPHTEFTSVVDSGSLTGKLAFYGEPSLNNGVWSRGAKLVEIDPDGWKSYVLDGTNSFKFFEISDGKLKFFGFSFSSADSIQIAELVPQRRAYTQSYLTSLKSTVSNGYIQLCNDDDTAYVRVGSGGTTVHGTATFDDDCNIGSRATLHNYLDNNNVSHFRIDTKSSGSSAGVFDAYYGGVTTVGGTGVNLNSNGSGITLNGNTSVTGTLGTSGKATLNSLEVTGASTLVGTSTLTGAATFNGGATFNNSTTTFNSSITAGAATFGGVATFNNGATFNTYGATFNGGILADAFKGITNRANYLDLGPTVTQLGGSTVNVVGTNVVLQGGSGATDYVQISAANAGIWANSGELLLNGGGGVQINGSGNRINIYSDGTHGLDLNDSNGHNAMYGQLNMGGNIDMAGLYNVVNTSDARLKTNIRDSSVNALKALTGVDMKSFDWLANGEHVSLGIIAQQLQKLAPELVCEDDHSGKLSIKEYPLIMYCVRAIQQIAEKLGCDIKHEKWSDPYTLEDKQNFIKLTGGEI